MCGIFGYISFINTSQDFVIKTLINGLKRLEYRGYDSAGICLLSSKNNELLVKNVGNIYSLEKKIEEQEFVNISLSGVIGIAHTRWATHGVSSELNTHPHFSDEKHDFIVVHNGIITNYLELKQFLKDQKFELISDTDTEVIPVLCKYFYNKNISQTFYNIIKNVIDRLEGSFAIVIISKHFPLEMMLYKRGSPLIVGVDNSLKHFIIASDMSAIIEHTNKILTLQEDDILHISNTGYNIYNTSKIVSRKFDIIDMEISQIMKGSYTHFMEKEIFEQDISITRTFNGRLYTNGDTSYQGKIGLQGYTNEIRFHELLEYNDMIQKSTRIILIACGSSYNACIATRPLYETMTNIPITIENSCDFIDRGDVFISPTDTCIFVSQSGETTDTLIALRITRKKRALCIGITNVAGSSIEKECHCTIHNNVGSEIGVASTKAYISQILVLIMFILSFSKDEIKRNEIIENIFTLPSIIKNILSQSLVFKKLINMLKKERNVLFIGRKYNFSTALEASLKLKEVAYLHCEGILAGELKHGPLALIDDNVLVIVIATDDPKMRSNIQQLASRKARMLIFTDCPLSYNEYNAIILPKIIKPLRPIIDIIPFQLISYYLALEKGYNVDQPRNLAKSVTITD